MAKWYETLDDSLWLRSDDGGEEEAVFIAKCLRLRPGNRVLDAPCGAGRIAIPLAKMGFDVIGVDLRKSFVNRARRRLDREGVSATLRVMDMRDLRYSGQFHGILNWFNSFGYFTDRENADLVIRFAEALRPGGRLVIDQWNRERILRCFEPEKIIGSTIFRSSWDARTQRNHLRRIVDGQDHPRNRSSQRWYTPAQLRELLTQAGLHIEAQYGSVHGEPYSRGSRQMITIARKEASKA